MIDAELLVRAYRAELDREAAGILRISSAQKLAGTEKRARRQPRDWLTPKYRHPTPGSDARWYWARLV